MATLRIRFPENEQPSVLLLEGARITVGRRPNNTIQIVNRMVSSAHAELKWEDDHYLLRDLDSTNGTWVNEEQITEFHLRESCKLRFGTFECEYDPQSLSEEGSLAEALPSRSEMDTLRQENSRLQGLVDTLRGEAELLRASSAGAVPLTEGGIPRELFEKVVAERQELQQKHADLEQELSRTKADLALLRSERESLQQALQVAAPGAASQPAVSPATPGVPLSAPAVSQPTPSPSVPAARPAPASGPGIPKPAGPSAVPAAPAPSGAGAPAMPTSPSTPRVPVNPVGVPSPARVAASAVPSATPRPGAPGQSPAAPGRPAAPGVPGPRPVPSSGTPGSGAAVPATPPRPAVAAVPKPSAGAAAVPVVRPAVQPAGVPKPQAAAPKVGPAGTQKMERPAAAGQPAAGMAPKGGIQPFPRAVPGSTPVPRARPPEEGSQSDPSKSDESAKE